MGLMRICSQDST